MKLRDLTYEEALKRHPLEVENLLWRLRRSRSKARLLSGAELQWAYECCLRVDGPISRKQTFEERAWDGVSRTGTCLQHWGIKIPEYSYDPVYICEKRSGSGYSFIARGFLSWHSIQCYRE